MDERNNRPGLFSANTGTPSEVPWPEPQSWQAANQILYDLTIRYEEQLDDCRLCAKTIRQHLTTIDPMMEAVCAATCPWCPEPCCMKATVWFDLPDLLLIHLLKTDILPGQPKVKRKDICRYLGPRGCRLPRHSRPWTCTRYICPTQKRWWQARASAHPAFFNDLANKIREMRRTMETTFIAIVSGNPETT